MAAVRVVTYNAHFGYMRMHFPDRTEGIAKMLLADPLAASTIFMIQEASTYLHMRLRNLAKETHTAYYEVPRGALMAVLTLVPKALSALEATETREGVKVHIRSFKNGGMGRQCHIVLLHKSGMALVNTHLESCKGNARVREGQLIEIGNAIAEESGGRENRFVIFGDLNWYSRQSGYLKYFPHGVEVAQQGAPRKFPEFSAHTLCTFLVR
jgi:endonuclease/exonuclease/phosphatase family metal-dependent hydrolase